MAPAGRAPGPTGHNSKIAQLRDAHRSKIKQWRGSSSDSIALLAKY
jgi:hypothetical protein